MRLEIHPTTQGHAGRQHIQHGQLNDPRCHRHVDIGVFRQRDVQAHRTGLGQWRVLGGHAQHRRTVFPSDTRHFHQLAGTASVGNDHEQLAGVRHRGDHALHQHVGVGGHCQVEAEELVQRVHGHGSRSAQAKEVDLPRLDQQVHGLADQRRVQGLAGTVQGGDGAAKDLLGVGLGVIIGLYGAADIRGATGQALRQLQFKFRVTADTERTAETVDRRFTDRGGLGEGGDREACGLLRVEQDHFSDFALGLVQFFEAVPDLFQKISHAVHSVFPSGDDANKKAVTNR